MREKFIQLLENTPVIVTRARHLFPTFALQQTLRFPEFAPHYFLFARRELGRGSSLHRPVRCCSHWETSCAGVVLSPKKIKEPLSDPEDRRHGGSSVCVLNLILAPYESLMSE